MHVLAPAKINLHLRVAPVGDSGFHPIRSWMCTVALFDTLTIESTGDGRISLQCDDPTLSCDDTNLVVRAAKAMAQEWRATPGQSAATPQIEHEDARGIRGDASHYPGVTIHLSKRIPAGGGLGGGSSDAAHTLLALNRLWQLNWPVEQLSRIAASLGSDVPFFLYGPSSLCTGRGEMVQPIFAPRAKWALLIQPGYPLPTPDVYRRFDQLGLGRADLTSQDPSLEQWADLLAGPLLHRLANDLEAPAFDLCPRLADLHRQVQQELGQIVRMSGSGSGLFTLYDEIAPARQAMMSLENRFQFRAVVCEIAPRSTDDLR